MKTNANTKIGRVYFLSIILPLALIFFFASKKEEKQNDRENLSKKESTVLTEKKVLELYMPKKANKSLKAENITYSEIEKIEEAIDRKIKKIGDLIAEETKRVLEVPVDIKKITTLRRKRAQLSKEVKKNIENHQQLTWLEMKKINPYLNNEDVHEWAKRKRDRL
jgi:hypothetical protein